VGREGCGGRFILGQGFAILVRRTFVFAIGAALLCANGCGSQPTGADSALSSTAKSTPATPVAASAATQSATAKAKLKPGAKTRVLERAGDKPYDKTFDDLRFEMTVGERFKRSMLTDGIKALDGQKIRIRGYILPTPQQHGIKQFVLVRDNQECCFGQGAALYDCVLVEMKKGSTADFTIRPIAVEGIFNVREFEVDGKQLAIYQMDGESAR
jgi:hypothetical protein